MVDALAVRADEGRSSQRYASVRWQATFDPEISEWGNLYTGRVYVLRPWWFKKREPREVKHLSSVRKRK
jgi:hypothetical protein